MQARLASKAFRPIDPEGSADRAFGWCQPSDPLETNVDVSACLNGDLLNLGMRIDTLRVPAALRAAHVRKEADRVRQVLGRTNLSRAELAEIRERVRVALRKKSLAAIKCVDVLWHVEEGTVHVFSGSASGNEFVWQLFHETFELEIVGESAAHAAQRAQDDLGANDDWMGVIEPMADIRDVEG
ncbi:MAG: recombination-associated protein RdgC [Myxococcales bacterium]|nr:recombination-associated protein RdgC [Myxococcales bacterium]